MAYKCKTCGYRFKKDDSDLCPECFTARDDVGCTNYEKHSHFKDLDSSKDDFISQQLKDERKSTFGDENSYNSNSSRSTAQPNYGASAKSTIKSDYNGGKSTLRFTTSYNGYDKLSSYQNNYTGFSENQIRNAKKIIIAVVIMMFMLPAISFIIAIVRFFKSDFSDSNETGNYYYVNNMTGYSDDYSITAKAENLEVSKVYYSLENAVTDSQSSTDIKISDENAVEESLWRKISCDIFLDDTDYLIEDIQLSGNDIQDDNTISESLDMSTAYDVYSTDFLICEDISEYTLTVTYTNKSDNSDSGTIDIEFSYDDIDDILYS